MKRAASLLNLAPTVGFGAFCSPVLDSDVVFRARSCATNGYCCGLSTNARSSTRPRALRRPESHALATVRAHPSEARRMHSATWARSDFMAASVQPPCASSTRHSVPCWKSTRRWKRRANPHGAGGSGQNSDPHRAEAGAEARGGIHSTGSLTARCTLGSIARAPRAVASPVSSSGIPLPVRAPREPLATPPLGTRGGAEQPGLWRKHRAAERSRAFRSECRPRVERRRRRRCCRGSRAHHDGWRGDAHHTA